MVRGCYFEQEGSERLERYSVEAVFREAEDRDLEVLVGLMQAYYRYEELAFDPVKARGAVAGLLTRPAFGRIWIIEAEEEAVGYLAVTLGFSLEYGGFDAFIDELFIVEGYRRQGLGRRALAVAEEACRACGVRALHLEVEHANAPALALYRRYGFVDHDRYLMTKALDLDG